jgi:hypothetical protein
LTSFSTPRIHAGQLNFEIADLGVDFIGFSLQKWIGAPVGHDNWFDGRFGSHTTDNGGALELRAAL